MRELQRLLKRFLAREIGLEELQRGFAQLLEDDGGLAAPAAAWLDAGEEDGRLSSAVCTSLKNVIVSHLATIADGPDPRESSAIGPDDFLKQEMQKERARNSPASAEPAKTQLIQASGTVLATGARAQDPDISKTRVVDRRVIKVDTVLKIGSVIGDRYELLSQLGSGGMGTVFKARDRLREEAQDRKPFVALKVLSEKFKEHPDSMIALQREARRAQSMAHPNVITVHEFFKDGPHFYMTMELLDGQPLDLLLRMRSSAAMPMEEAWPIIESIGKALQYGHEQGIVHSDVKPGNIFVGKNSVVKVLDFGISRPIPLTDAPETDQTVFDARKRLNSLTPSYASLEMWYQDTPDPRDDIYSLACVAYLLLSGRHPFDGSSAKDAYDKNLEPKRIDSLARSQWSALSRGLALRRRNRIASVAEFLSLLAPTTVDRSRRRLMALAGVLILLLSGAVALHYYRIALEDEFLRDRDDVSVSTEPIDLSPMEQQELEDLIELARHDLAGIPENANAADLDYLLSHSSSSVMQSVQTALDMNPHDADALQVKQQVFDLYSRKAQDFFDAEDYESAWLMASNAKEISNKRAVRRLLDSICDQASEVCRK